MNYKKLIVGLIIITQAFFIKADLGDFRTKLSQYQQNTENNEIMAELVDAYLTLNMQEIQRANQTLKQAGLNIVALRKKSEEIFGSRIKKLELQAQTKDKQRNKIAADLSKAQKDIMALEEKLEAGKISTKQANLQLEMVNRQLENVQGQNSQLHAYLKNYSQAIETALPKNVLIGSEENFGGKRFILIGQNGLVEQLKIISQELANLTEQSPELLSKEKEYNKIVEELKESLSGCNVNKETISQEVEELKQKNDNLNKTKTDLESLVKNLEEKLKQANSSSQNSELIKKFQQASSDINKLTKERDYLISKVRDLTSELSRSQENKSERVS